MLVVDLFCLGCWKAFNNWHLFNRKEFFRWQYFPLGRFIILNFHRVSLFLQSVITKGAHKVLCNDQFLGWSYLGRSKCSFLWVEFFCYQCVFYLAGVLLVFIDWWYYSIQNLIYQYSINSVFPLAMFFFSTFVIISVFFSNKNIITLFFLSQWDFIELFNNNSSALQCFSKSNLCMCVGRGGWGGMGGG